MSKSMVGGKLISCQGNIRTDSDLSKIIQTGKTTVLENSLVLKFFYLIIAHTANALSKHIAMKIFVGRF